jgi:membrane-bound ClpP family serine protease
LRLASYLASLDPGRIRTVAYVPTEARGDAALIALACDQLVVADRAVLGGPAIRRISASQMQDIRIAVQQIAHEKGKTWSMLMAMVDQDLQIRRYLRDGTDVAEYFCEQELAEQDNSDAWKQNGELDTRDGIQGWQALEAQLAVSEAADFSLVKAAYQLDSEIPIVRPNWAHRLIEFLAAPHIAGGLLFIGWFALMFEFMSPGVGLPGFIAAVCFLLFFWSNTLHGTAGWLEILLFAAGVICIALEIFVIPGFGAFGVGGGALIVSAIVLASQTFVIPRNAYEWSQMPGSLLVVAAAGAGIITALVFMRQALTQAPVFRRVALVAPDEEKREQLRYQESLVHREHLLGKRGLTATQLTPSGKATFGDETIDVISDGDVIPAGRPVAVADVRGNEVLVREIN